MDFSSLSELKIDNILFKKISSIDSQFIETMFSDKDVKKYYIVPKEAHQDYKKLINYWLNDISKGAGYSWIIYQKGDGLFSSIKPCGFIAFEFRDNLKNARISYALKPENRKKGLGLKSVEFIISKLKSLGVETIEADIDTDNSASENLVVKLGFETNRKSTLVDPEMMRDGDIRLRLLWRKLLFDYSELDFFVINQLDFAKIINSKTVFKIWEEEISSNVEFMQINRGMKATGKFHFSFKTNVTESIVGISDDNTLYNIVWELLREESYKGKAFMVFCGWGDQMSTGIRGGLPNFDYYEIGVEKPIFENLLRHLMQNNPDFFARPIMKNVIGLESFNL